MISFETKVPDQIDRSILSRLLIDGRATWADLAHDLGLTAPAIAQRVRRLEDRGVIRHFAAVISPESVAPLAALVWVRLARPPQRDRALKRLLQVDQVLECHYVGQESTHLLKVRCAGLPELATLVSETLTDIAGVDVVSTTVILDTLKESAVLPLPEATA